MNDDDCGSTVNNDHEGAAGGRPFLCWWLMSGENSGNIPFFAFGLVSYPVAHQRREIITKQNNSNSRQKFQQRMCMVTHIARVWINQVRLPVLHVVT